MPNNNKIKIAMLEISPQNKAILEFYFDRAGKNLYSVASEAEADAFIIDYDQFGAKEHVTEILAEQRLPILLISIREQNIPSTIWLAKPLSADALNIAANSVKELIAHNETIAASAEAEAEAEKAAFVEEENQEIEVLTNVHIKEDETLLDESSEVLNTLEESTSEESIKIDEMVLEEESIEEVAEENSAVDSGLAIAGVAASALVTSSIIADDSEDENDDVKNIDIEDNPIEESSIQQEEIVTDTANTDSTEEDDVDSLLDSLISEQEADEQLAEHVSENETEEDMFLELLSEDDLKDTDDVNISNNTESSIDIDVLKSVDSKLEDNMSLQKSMVDNVEDEQIINVEKEGIVEENFTLHDDHDPSSEDVFADTLEVNYSEVKSEESDLQLDTDSANSEDLPTLSLDENEVNTTQEDTLQSNSDETVDDDFSFDIETTEDTHVDPELGDDFELTLLNEVETEDQTTTEENAETEAADDFETDLDSLLEEVSGDNEEVTEVIENLENAEFDEVETTAESTNEIDKELDDSDLQSLLNEVREEAKTGVSGGTDAESSYEQTEAEKRWMQLCGNESEVKSQKDAAKITFKNDNHLLGVILEQIKTTKNKEQLFRLKYGDLIIVIDHSQNKVYCNTPLSSDEYSVICHSEVEAKKVKIHDLDYSEERLYRTKIEKNPGRSHSFESFIWTTSLLTSRGRLPENTSVTKPVGLKNWPDLTRLELIPHAMNVAAVFAKHPGNLIEVANWLNIQQRYVFAFYNAALSLDMIEFDVKKAKKSGFSFGKKDSKKNSEERGFFGRLLKRLKT